MNPIKKTINWLSDFVTAIGKEKGFTGSGVDSRYAREIENKLNDIKGDES